TTLFRSPLPQTFVAEAELVDHTQTGGVLRADVDLDAVESEREEAVVDGHRHGDGSDAATGHTRVDPVPDLPGQDRPPVQARDRDLPAEITDRSEEHTSELQSRIERV